MKKYIITYSGVTYIYARDEKHAKESIKHILDRMTIWKGRNSVVVDEAVEQ